MNENLTTFQMAQAAYENPGKVFVCQAKVKACWDQRLTGVVDPVTLTVLPLGLYQENGYVWEEERTPRKWSGEYEAYSVNETSRRPAQPGTNPWDAKPKGVKYYRVKWEAEEVL